MYEKHIENKNITSGLSKTNIRRKVFTSAMK